MDNRNDSSTNLHPLIEATHLKELLGEEDLVVFDCRFALSDTEKGRSDHVSATIPGAIYAHLDDDLSSVHDDPTEGRHPLPDAKDFAAFLSRHGVHEGSLLVAFDDAGGPFAARFWWLCHWIGMRQVSVLDGGWQAWRTIDGPVAPGSQRVENSASDDSMGDLLSLQPDESMLASRDDLVAANTVLVDSRAAERYRGEMEPIDPIAGHIPGATNHPWKLNLDEAGRFRSTAELHNELPSSKDGELPVTFYCGSGVTACHNILASVVAGLPMPRLFAPSWSGWIAHDDPDIAVSGPE